MIFFSKFQTFNTKVENKIGLKINALRSNRDGKQLSNKFTRLYEPNNIIHQLTAIYSSQSNGIAKRQKKKIQDLSTKVNAMIISSGLTFTLQGEAIFLI